jgi:hypothetical protein
MHFAGASMAKAKDRDVDNSTAEGKLTDKKPLSAWGLIDLINRGDIIDVPPMLGGPSDTSSPINAESPATLSAPSRQGHFALSADAAHKHDYLARKNLRGRSRHGPHKNKTTPNHYQR